METFCQLKMKLKNLNPLTTKKERVTIAPPLGTKTSHCCAEAQGMLIDIMSDRCREADDLDFILRDALRRNKDSAPDTARVFAALCAQVAAERRPAYTPWLPATPAWTSPHLLASYWYLAPISRVIR
jgi:hypothetical protein